MKKHTAKPVKAFTALTGLFFVAFLVWSVALAGDTPPTAPAVLPATESPLQVGMARVDITPDATQEPFQLNGYGDRHGNPAEGVMDPLYVRALVVRNAAGEQIGIVSADLCYIGSELREAVLAALAGDGFTEHNLLLAATHDHSGFANYDQRYIARKFFGEFQPAIFDMAVSRFVQAVRQATQNRQPATLETATILVPGMNRNRRDPAFDIGTGSGPTGIQPDTVRYPTDERMTTLAFKSLDGKPLAAVVHYTAHPTILSPKNMQASADWPGVMCNAVEKQTGYPTLFLNGALGDAAPLPDWQDDLAQEIADMKTYGAAMAEHAARALAAGQPTVRIELQGFTAYRDMTRIVARPLWGMRLPGFLAKAIYERPTGAFQAMRLGQFVFFAIPGEPTYALGEELNAFCPPDSQCRVVAPANGYNGYFVTPSEYDEGTYASDSCFYGREAHKLIAGGIERAMLNMQAGY